PMLVTYRVNPMTAVIAHYLVKVKYASLLNLLVDREVVPELIQRTCNPDRLAAELAPLLMDPAAAAAQRAAFREPLAMLAPPGGGSPSESAAAAVLDLLPHRS
ncbi:MAG: lipid-A-disaccharide synthase, partial [Acetobacteraceae bacterium]